jgi:hypothetical protein
MATLPRRRAPLWFYVLVAAVCAALARGLAPASLPLDAGRPGTPPLQLAWFTWLLTLVEALWTGVEVAGKVALVVLQYSVTIAWRAITLLGKGAAELAQYAWRGARIAWQLLADTYDHVLKPAWQFFFRWVDRVEQWLERVFGPLAAWLRRVRDWVISFYGAYVRPILDVIDLGRRALRVLGSLGVDWARALDARLGALEDLIERPFHLVLAKLNEVIGWIDRVITLDGLLQRAAFLKTLARDVHEAVNQFGWGLHNPISGQDADALRQWIEKQNANATTTATRAYLAHSTTEANAVRASVAASWRASLQK